MRTLHQTCRMCPRRLKRTANFRAEHGLCQPCEEREFPVSKLPPDAWQRRCRNHPDKYAQRYSDGLCRECDTAEHGYRTSREREVAIVQRKQEREAEALAKVQRRLPKPPDFVHHQRVINGVVFDVRWNGTAPGEA